MHPKKLKFSNDVVRIVMRLVKTLFNITTEKQLISILGMNEEHMRAIVKKIINSFPKHIFDQVSTHSLDEIKNICAREFIFFQVQGAKTKSDYENDLQNFTCILAEAIQQRLAVINPEKTKGGDKL